MRTLVACFLAWSVNALGSTSWNDRGALKMLYWATGGTSWKNRWPILNSRSDPCLDHWYGILCNTKGQIISLHLSGNHLRGYLPPLFARLSALQELDFSSNYLTDSLPSSLGDLTSLTTLRLDHNSFTGAIPTSIAKLPYLATLTLEVNHFDGPLPIQLYSLQYGATFYLSYDLALMPREFPAN